MIDISGSPVIFLLWGRRKRITLGGYVYHVINRANGRLRIFRKAGDFAAFEAILAAGLERVDMRICGYCIMGNHWHLLLWPRADGDLSDYLRWITLTHTQRYHVSHGTVGIGHLYQGRYKSFPVQHGGHYLTVLRYIEANPLRAEIVTEPDDYQWSSFVARQDNSDKPFKITPGPVTLPANWPQHLKQNINQQDKQKLETSLKRGAPFGDNEWIGLAAAKLGLESTLREKGRPKKCTGHLHFYPV